MLVSIPAQNLDGVDVILFAMYVYEYGINCPLPNNVSPLAARASSTLKKLSLSSLTVCRYLLRALSVARTSRTWTRCTTSVPESSARPSTTRSSSPTWPSSDRSDNAPQIHTYTAPEP